MAWVAVDQDGDEYIYHREPNRSDSGEFFCISGKFVYMPSGSIQKLIGRPLTWDDGPVELTENLPIDKR